ncbi:MAG TPA: SpoIIE family protein phosphatase [Vicinamibacterales bacterium]|jgi:serine phosphatase RsbU (regulator of sigma subunit)
MNLRSRLTFAFFAISVVPLSAVTLYSHYSSERALRRAAEQQAQALAADMGHRMEWVTADLGRRMDRLWPEQVTEQADARPTRPAGPEGVRPQPSPSEAMAGHVAGTLGAIAPMLESLELVPTVTTPPAAPYSGSDRAPLPVPPPAEVDHSRRRPTAEETVARRDRVAAVADARKTVGTRKMVVEMSQVIAQALKPYASGNAGTSATEMAAWNKALADQIDRNVANLGPVETSQARSGAAAVGTAGGENSPRPQGAPGRVRAFTVLKGNAINTEVQRDGRPIGRISGTLNIDRLLHTVMSLNRRDRQEIPFAVDGDGHLHAPRASDETVIRSLGLASALPAGGISVRSVNDWVVATRKDPSGSTFGIARPIGDDVRELRRVSARNFGLGFALIALVFAGSIPLAGGMTRNLRTLMDGVQRLARGDLGTRVPVRSRDEFGRLGVAFNQMAENLAAHEKLVVEQERIKRELELCRQIQTEMLPHQPLRFGLAEARGLSIPAREVGGDFFNYFVLPDGGIALLVGDVSGKGVGAALLMANVQATLRARLPLEQDLATLADGLDHDLQAATPSEVYLTLFVGIVDPVRRVLRYVNAGHNTQFVLRRDGGLERLASTGRPLGLLAGAGYEERAVTLGESDQLFLYTDGMVEAESETGEFLGPERLESLLLEGLSTDVEALLARVELAVREFRGAAEPSDDATMMAFRFGPTPDVAASPGVNQTA